MRPMTNTDTTERAAQVRESTRTGPSYDDQTVADGVFRRGVLRASAVAMGALAVGGPAAARESTPFDDPKSENLPDVSVGFYPEVLARHATFTDGVAAQFRLQYENGRTIVSNLPRDASTVVFAKVTWDREGTSGWHTHPGPVVVSVVAGELELVNARDCVPRRYGPGEAFVDPGQGSVHIATNTSSSDQAVAYATFFGVPAGTSPTIMVPPVECASVSSTP